MMRKSFIDFHRNLSQVSKLDNCKIVLQKKDRFSIELYIRDRRYKIRLDYYEKKYPDVFVVSPEINMSHSTEIHTFGMHYHPAYKKKIPRLCLTHLATDKWNSSIPLINSYIPWAVEWTEFYEMWLLTGKWYGKGIHIGREDKNDAA